MDRIGQHTFDEIESQPRVWSAVLERLRRDLPDVPSPLDYDTVIFTGCGSTHYLSLWAARHCQAALGLPAVAVPASDLVLRPDAWLRPSVRTLLVTVSRSATTTETQGALATFRKRGTGSTVAITCHPERGIGRDADYVVPVPDGGESSVVQTRSFTSMMLGAAWLVLGPPNAQLAERLESRGERLLPAWRRQVDALALDEIDRFFFLGQGARYGLACEGMLKIKEMALAHAEAYHTLEIRHGPMSLVDPHALVVALLPPAGNAEEERVIDDMRGLGAATTTLRADEDLRDALPSMWRDVLFLPWLHLLAYRHARDKGMDPDAPRHLSPVVELSQL